jgi:hypothetical protein
VGDRQTHPWVVQLPENLIIFAKKKSIFQMNGQKKCFKKMTLEVPLFKNTKGTWFFTF